MAPAPRLEAAPTTAYSRADLNAVNGSDVAGFVGPPTGRGWYQDATDVTEKIVTDVYADVQTVVYAFSKPTTDPCAAPLSSRLYARDFNTGNSVLVSGRWLDSAGHRHHKRHRRRRADPGSPGAVVRRAATSASRSRR